MDKTKIKKMEGYPDYLMFNIGMAYNLKTEKFLGDTKERYIRIAMTNDKGERNWFYLHRLIYELFKGPIPQGYEINHIDQNPHNNHIDNLELMTIQQNRAYGTRAEKISRSNKGLKKSKNSFQVEYDGQKKTIETLSELLREYPEQVKMTWNYRLHHSKNPQQSYFSLLDGKVLKITPLNEEYKQRLNDNKENK